MNMAECLNPARRVFLLPSTAVLKNSPLRLTEREGIRADASILSASSRFAVPWGIEKRGVIGRKERRISSENRGDNRMSLKLFVKVLSDFSSMPPSRVDESRV